MWFDRDRRLLEEIRKVYQAVEDVLSRLPPNQSTRKITVKFTGAMPMPNNELTLSVGQTSQASIVPLLADGITPSGGTLSNVNYQFNDPSATVVPNADGVTAIFTGVAASNGPISGTATCTVTDTDGAVSQWSQGFSVTTNGSAPPQQLTQSVAVQFTDPGGAAPSGTNAPKPLNE